MRDRFPLISALVLLSALLAGCAATDGSSSSPAASDDLGEFTCTLPVNGVATVGLAHLTDVEVSTHSGFDRVVFTFDEGTPEFSLVAATAPYLADPSGLEIEVHGERALQLTFNGGTKLRDDGSLSYDGSVNITTEFPWLAHLVEAGDFEAVNTWFIGLSAATDPCVRVRLTTAPNAVIIEINQPTSAY
jgi:hypothetical protein